MKITLEFTDIEKFFTELPRFAALMNFSGQFASFDHVKKSDLISNLEEPAVPYVFTNEDGKAMISGTEEQLTKTKEAGEIADKTVEQLDKRKKEAAAKKAAKAKAAETPWESTEEAQEKPEETKAANSTPEEEKPAQKPAAAASVKDTDVRKALNKLIQSGHREDVKTILSEFGAENFSKLDEKHFAAVLQKAKEVLDNDD